MSWMKMSALDTIKVGLLHLFPVHDPERRERRDKPHQQFSLIQVHHFSKSWAPHWVAIERYVSWEISSALLNGTWTFRTSPVSGCS